MRAARVTAEETVELHEVHVPEPGPGEALVRVVLCGICGSDLHGWRGKWGFPFYPGHEVCGVVVALGEAAPGPPLGTRVAVEPHNACGICCSCRRGDWVMCGSCRYLFGGPLGGFAERVPFPVSSLHAVADSLTDEEVMMVEPLAVAVAAADRAGLQPGMKVGLVGAGAIGLLCAAVAAARGADVLLAVDMLPHRLRAAAALGVKHGVVAGQADPAAVAAQAGAPGGLDVVFEAAGADGALTCAIALARKEGRVVALGVPQEPVTVDTALLASRRTEVVGSFCYGARDGIRHFTTAAGLIRAGDADAARLVTHVLPLDEEGRAFGLAAGQTDDAIKVAVRVTE